MKKVTGWLIALVVVSLAFWIGFLIVPAEPTLRMLALFLYFYICVEFGAQFVIARKKAKEDELRGKDK